MTETRGELILIRHGKADPREESADDAQRQLTENGIKELKKILPELKSHLESTSALELCSSSLVRAVQTAQIIAGDLEINEIQQLDWIENGSYTRLYEKLKDLKPSASLIVVGHEPHLSDWARQLTGFRIPFRKGTAVGFHIQPAEPLRAEPKWMILPETADPQNLNIKRSQPALQAFQRILRFQLHEIFIMLRKFIDAPDEPETAHQFRVRVRTFRSTLSFIKPLLGPEYYQTLQEQMKKLAQMMGRIREIDVLKMEWVKLLETHPELVREPSALTAVLASERQKEQTKIYSSTSEMMADLFNVWDWVENAFVPEIITATEAESRKKSEKEHSFENYSANRVRRWIKQANAGLQTMDTNDFGSIHAMRIRFKKLRYALNALNPLLELEKAATILSMKKLQDIFGDYCDTERNLIILKELNDQHTGEKMSLESGIMSGYQVRIGEENLDEIKRIDSLPFRTGSLNR